MKAISEIRIFGQKEKSEDKVNLGVVHIMIIQLCKADKMTQVTWLLSSLIVRSCRR